MTNAVKKGRIKREKIEARIYKFVFYSVVYAAIMGLLYGTVQMNLGTVQVVGWLWMSFEQMFVILGLAGWALLSWYIWRGKISFKGFET